MPAADAMALKGPRWPRSLVGWLVLAMGRAPPCGLSPSHRQGGLPGVVVSGQEGGESRNCEALLSLAQAALALGSFDQSASQAAWTQGGGDVDSASCRGSLQPHCEGHRGQVGPVSTTSCSSLMPSGAPSLLL